MVWKAIGRWILLAIAVPLAAVGLRRLGQRIESRRGQSTTTAIMRRSADGLDWVSGRPPANRR